MKKKVLFPFIMVAVISIITSCGGSSNADSAKEESVQSENVTAPPTPPKKDPVTVTVSPVQVFVGEITIEKNEATGAGEIREPKSEYTSLPIVFEFNGGQRKTLNLYVQELWDTSAVKNVVRTPSYSEQMQKFLTEVQKLKPENFSITTVDGEIRKAVILAVYKENKDGVGQLVSPEREIWPSMYFESY
jgi:hypothetical protein